MGSPGVEAIVTARDEASAVLRAVARIAQETARNIEKTGQGPNHLANNYGAATLAAERHISVLQRMQGIYHRMAQSVSRFATMASPVVGGGIIAATKNVYHHGADIQSELVKLESAGVPEDERRRALAQSAELSTQFTNVHRAAILEMHKELRSVLLHPEEVPRLLPDVVNAKAVLDATDKTGNSSAGLQFLVKGTEVLGLAQEPARFKAYIDSAVKAMQVMGKQINPEQIFEVAKYAKASGPTLSDRFKLTTALSLAQELGGSTTGQSIDQFVKQIVGGFQGQNHAAAKEFVALGLAKKDDFLTTKTGDIKGMKSGRRVAGASLAASDPDKWVQQYLLPALVAHGYDTDEKIISEIRRMFPAGRAADLVTKLFTQRESFENHAKLYENAQGLDAWRTLAQDLNAQVDAFKTTMENIGGTLTSPAMKDAALNLQNVTNSLAGWGKDLANWQTEHPVRAKAIAGGALATGAAAGGGLLAWFASSLFSGFGLGTSAVALDGSAAALGGAAASLEAAAATLGIAGKAGAAADLGKSAVSTAATGAASTVAASGAAAAMGGGALSALGWAGTAIAAAFAIPYAIKAAKDAGYLKPLEDFNRKYLDPHDNAETAFNRLRYGKNISPEDIKTWRESVPFSFEGWGAATLRSGKKFKADGEEAKELKLLDPDSRSRLSKFAKSLPIFAQHRLEPSIEKAEQAKNVLALNRALEPSKQASVSSEKAKRVKAEHIKEIVKVTESSAARVSFPPSVPRVEKLAPTFAGRLERIEKPTPVPTFAKFDATQLSKDFGKVNVDVNSEVAVHGDVKGEATLMQTVRVDASPQLLATVESARQTTKLNLTGEFQRNKTGRTMAGSNAARSSAPLGTGPAGFKTTSTGF